MPKPIVCLSATLRQFCEAFRGCFSQRQWKYFVIVLLGLIECEQRRTLRGLLANIGEQVSLCGLSRFFHCWKWRPEDLAQVWLSRFRQQLQTEVEAEHLRQQAEREKRRGRPKKTVVTGYLIFDDSVHVKPRGWKMQGLGKHYSSTERRVVRGHSLLTGLYVLLGRRCPLQPHLYRQRSVCQAENVPFQSKIELVIEAIQQFEPLAGTQTHVLIDSWFHCKAVRKAAQKRGWEVSGGLKSNRKMRLIEADGSRHWISLAEYAAQLQPGDWQEASWPSQEGKQKVYVHALRTHIRKLGPALLLITCKDPQAPTNTIRYWGSTLLEAAPQTVINILAIRWRIEVFFEDAKDLLGSDHYQLMSAEAIVRFWTLIACLSCFLDEQCAADSRLATWGDARRALQQEHQRNLLAWLYTQFQSGLTPLQIVQQLSLSSC
ncbi:MAG: transposase [Armatimonadota bacterium]